MLYGVPVLQCSWIHAFLYPASYCWQYVLFGEHLSLYARVFAKSYFALAYPLLNPSPACAYTVAQMFVMIGLACAFCCCGRCNLLSWTLKKGNECKMKYIIVPIDNVHDWRSEWGSHIDDFIDRDPFHNIYLRKKDDDSRFFYVHTDYLQYLQYLIVIWNRIKEEYKMIAIYHRKSLELTSKQLSNEQSLVVNNVNMQIVNTLRVCMRSQ
jgi:hypothetical protein